MNYFCRCDVKIARHAAAAVATAAPDDIDVGECIDCRKGWTHECPLDQSQSAAPEPKEKRIRTNGGHENRDRGHEMRR